MLGTCSITCVESYRYLVLWRCIGVAIGFGMCRRTCVCVCESMRGEGWGSGARAYRAANMRAL